MYSMAEKFQQSDTRSHTVDSDLVIKKNTDEAEIDLTDNTNFQSINNEEGNIKVNQDKLNKVDISDKMCQYNVDSSVLINENTCTVETDLLNKINLQTARKENENSLRLQNFSIKRDGKRSVSKLGKHLPVVSDDSFSLPDLSKVANNDHNYSRRNSDKDDDVDVIINNIVAEYKKGKLYSCCYCPSTYRRGDTLRFHLKMHFGLEPFKCNYCQAKFVERRAYENHVKLHTRLQIFICSYCKAEFNHKGYLKIHVRKHTGEKPFKCDLCNKAFHSKRYLTTHIARHIGIKQFLCHQCGRGFYEKNRLNAHLKMHAGGKPHECHACGYRSYFKYNLVQHIRRHENKQHEPIKKSQSAIVRKKNKSSNKSLVKVKCKNGPLTKVKCSTKLLVQAEHTDRQPIESTRTTELLTKLVHTLENSPLSQPEQGCIEPSVDTPQNRIIESTNKLQWTATNQPLFEIEHTNFNIVPTEIIEMYMIGSSVGAGWGHTDESSNGIELNRLLADMEHFYINGGPLANTELTYTSIPLTKVGTYINIPSTEAEEIHANKPVATVGSNHTNEPSVNVELTNPLVTLEQICINKPVVNSECTYTNNSSAKIEQLFNYRPLTDLECTYTYNPSANVEQTNTNKTSDEIELTRVYEQSSKVRCNYINEPTEVQQSRTNRSLPVLEWTRMDGASAEVEYTRMDNNPLIYAEQNYTWGSEQIDMDELLMMK